MPGASGPLVSPVPTRMFWLPQVKLGATQNGVSIGVSMGNWPSRISASRTLIEFPYTRKTLEPLPTSTYSPARNVPSVMKAFFATRMRPPLMLTEALPSMVASLLYLAYFATANAAPSSQSQTTGVVVLVLDDVVDDVDVEDELVLVELDDDVEVLELVELEVLLDVEVDVDEDEDVLLLVDELVLEELVLDDVLLLEEELLDDVEDDELLLLEVDDELDEDVELELDDEELDVDEDVEVDEVDDDELVDDEDEELEVDELDDDELVDVEDEELEVDVLDDDELVDDEDEELEVDELDDEELVLVDELLLDEEVVVVEVVVVVVGGGGRPSTPMRSARHFATVPGTVWAMVVQSPLVLLSQLTTVPTSTTLSASVSTHTIVTPRMLRSVLTPCSMSPHRSAALSPW